MIHSLGKTLSLLTFSSLTQLVGYLFVDFPPVTDGENPDSSGFGIGLVNNPKPFDFDPPQSG
jgi:hypothetical protein